MKKAAALGLSLALTASMTLPALAAEAMPISAKAGYDTAITLNGQVLDTSAIPAVDGENMIPLRLIAESDYGSASWFEEENNGWFYLEGGNITVNFADNSITVGDESEGVLAPIAALKSTSQGTCLFVKADAAPDNAVELEDGVEMLIHVGINTVALKGEGFRALVKEGDQVKKGDRLLEFDLDFIRENATSVSSPVLFTSMEDNQELRLLKAGHVEHGEDLLALDIYES